MIKLFSFCILCCLSSSVFAADVTPSPVSFDGINGFFETSLGYFDSFWNFIFYDTPSMITRFFAWLETYIIYLKIYTLVSSLQFAHQVALNFIEQMNITSVVNVATAALPNDVRQTLIDVRFFDGLSLIIEAFITRLIFSMSN